MAHKEHSTDIPTSTVKARTPKADDASGVAQDGDTVAVHYTGTFDDGEVFDTSSGREPIEFVVGEHVVILGFEDGVRGLKKGEKKDITLEPSEAYGDPNPEMVQEVPLEALGDIKPEVGMMLGLRHPMAPQPLPAKVLAVSDTTVKIDLNHPLAGKRLHFTLELVEIK